MDASVADRPGDFPQAYEFGPYRLEPLPRRLLRNGGPVALTPKAFDVLLALVKRRERVVDKSELLKIVWPDSFVEESNLSQTIFVLRKTLGEAPDGRPFIDTMPRRGYRFAAVVREVLPMPPVAAVRAATVSRRVPAIAAALLIVIALAWAGSSWAGRWRDDSARVESLVVLPFSDFSGGEEHDGLADSVTDALTTSLGQIAGLRVISRTSATTYRSTSKTVPQIARELNVDAVIEGTVQRAASGVRLNLKLIQGSTDRTIWA